MNNYYLLIQELPPLPDQPQGVEWDAFLLVLLAVWVAIFLLGRAGFMAER